jgi:hypothetical protein
MNMDHVPDERELVSLLGEKVHDYYRVIRENIVSLLLPDLEIWDHAGRRGKYFHGWQISKKSMTVDLYLSSIDGRGQVTCSFHFIKRFFLKILKHRNDLSSEQVQQAIDFSTKFNEEFGGGYSVSVIIRDEESFLDILKIIKIAATPARRGIQATSC